MEPTREKCCACHIVWPMVALHKHYTYKKKDGSSKVYYKCNGCAAEAKRKQRAPKIHAEPPAVLKEYGTMRAADLEITEVSYNED